jgi:hypothetical protein
VDHDGGNPRRRGEGVRLTTERGRYVPRGTCASSSATVVTEGGVNGLAPSPAKMRLEPPEEDEMDVDTNGNDEGTNGATI